MRYGATIAGLIGLAGIVVAAALFLGSDAEGTQRFSIIAGMVGLAVMALANNLKTDIASADAKEVKNDLKEAIVEGQSTTPAALAALTTMLRRTEKTVNTIEHNVNGPAVTERTEAASERQRVQVRDASRDATKEPTSHE